MQVCGGSATSTDETEHLKRKVGRRSKGDYSSHGVPVLERLHELELMGSVMGSTCFACWDMMNSSCTIRTICCSHLNELYHLVHPHVRCCILHNFFLRFSSATYPGRVRNLTALWKLFTSTICVIQSTRALLSASLCNLFILIDQ
jgi:hypothetical protein